MGIDVGIANFLTTSTGRQYRTFHGKLAARHERDRQTRRRKAKLRACLKKQGVQYLPSTRNRTLARHVRQEINRAVNAVSREHPDAQFAYEQLNVAGMKFKARRMTADLYAANLAHTLPIWPIRCQSGPHSGSARLALGQARQPNASGQERIQFPGMPALSFGVPREPSQPTDCLLCGLRA